VGESRSDALPTRNHRDALHPVANLQSVSIGLGQSAMGGREDDPAGNYGSGTRISKSSSVDI